MNAKVPKNESKPIQAIDDVRQKVSAAIADLLPCFENDIPETSVSHDFKIALAGQASCALACIKGVQDTLNIMEAAMNKANAEKDENKEN